MLSDKRADLLVKFKRTADNYNTSQALPIRSCVAFSLSNLASVDDLCEGLMGGAKGPVSKARLKSWLEP